MAAIKEAGKNDNTERAHVQDLKYLRGWVEVARGESWALPLPGGTVLAFITFHLAPNPILDQRVVTAGIKAKTGPHSLSTIRRRLATLPVAHRGCDESPVRYTQVRALLADSARALAKQGVATKRADALTRDVLDPLLATCGDDLLGDRALLLTGVGAGGRRTPGSFYRHINSSRPLINS